MDESFPTILVMLGATGDLARRKLIPALWDLYKDNHLSPLFQVVGVSRDELTSEEWRAMVKELVAEKADDEDDIDGFCKMFSYQTGLFEDKEVYVALAEGLGRKDNEWKTCANKLFYLAVPPPFYENIFQQLSDSGLTEPCSEEEGWTRVVVEKPFGKDLETAQKLDAMLGDLFQEEQIYRIDHYLGKDTVRNVLAFRFSNTFLQPAWDSRSIGEIRVRISESLTVGERGSFYDGVGALRDVGQNHLLQLLALFTMEKPERFEAEDIRKEREKILEALEIMDEQDIARRTVRGQYDGYKEEEGVAGDSETETYFRLETEINSTRWRGVRIVLESGKALDDRVADVKVTFRHQTPCLCPPEEGKHYTNVLTYRIQPHEGVSTSFWVKRPGTGMVIEEKEFSFDYEHEYGGEAFMEAYSKLLLDVIKGDQTLFVSTPEITQSWRFVDQIERAWQKDVSPLVSYAIGADSSFAKVSRDPSLEKSIGYIGLGKMGLNMVSRLTDHGWGVIATDPNEEARVKVESYGAKSEKSAVEVVQTLRESSDSENITIWIMVPHQFVDDVLEELTPHLKEGDVLIDGGNSNYKESVRRAQELSGKGINYLDVGVSGGPSGARAGSCLMIGGDREVYKKMVGLFGDLSVAAGFDYMGQSGAGHFVKMVHNGIEYGMMQAIGEGFEVIKEAKFELEMERIAHLYNHGSVIESSLVGWLKDAYEQHGSELDDISGEVSHSGEGQWTVEVAKELGIPVPIIEGSLQFRIDSEGNPSYTGQVVSALRNQFGGHDVKRK